MELKLYLGLHVCLRYLTVELTNLQMAWEISLRLSTMNTVSRIPSMASLDRPTKTDYTAVTSETKLILLSFNTTVCMSLILTCSYDIMFDLKL